MCGLVKRGCGCGPGHTLIFRDPCSTGTCFVPVRNGSPAPDAKCLRCQRQDVIDDYDAEQVARQEEESRALQASARTYAVTGAEFDQQLSAREAARREEAAAQRREENARRQAAARQEAEPPANQDPWAEWDKQHPYQAPQPKRKR